MSGTYDDIPPAGGAADTDQLPEGVVNLYFTNARAVAAVTLGMTTDDLAEGVTNLYYTDERVDDRVDSLIQDGTGLTWTYNDPANTLIGNVSLSPFSTTDLAEGTNLYFTDARAQAAIAHNQVAVSSSPYSITATDFILRVDTSAARTINLPNPATTRRIEIKDVTGGAETNNITIARFAAEKIENVAANYTVAIAYAHITLLSDGTDWWVINVSAPLQRRKAGRVASGTFAGSPKKATVTFTTAFPSANYAVTITGADARVFTIESKVAGSFVINANANTALTGDVNWVAFLDGEQA